MPIGCCNRNLDIPSYGQVVVWFSKIRKKCVYVYVGSATETVLRKKIREIRKISKKQGENTRSSKTVRFGPQSMGTPTPSF